MRGWVGPRAAADFCTYLAARDLYDVDEVLDGTAKVKADKSRVDSLIHLPWCISEAIKSRAKNGSLNDSHVTNGVATMLELGENDLLDCVVGPMNAVANAAPDWDWPDDLSDRWGSLIEQCYA
jgi:hypothetical protein